jgi:hypothetical protein
MLESPRLSPMGMKLEMLGDAWDGENGRGDQPRPAQEEPLRPL